MKKKVLGIIPARGGSKGIPNKNLIKIGDYSLLERALFTAMGSNVLSKIIVSSDSKKIIDKANSYGNFAPFTRPSLLATDNAKSLPVIQHALKWSEKTEKRVYDLVALIEPPCVFRLNTHIDDAVEIAIEKNASSVMSLVEVGDYHPIRMKKIDEKGSIIPYNIKEPEGLRRQDQEPVYIRNGAVYIFSRDTIFSNKLWGERPQPFIMDNDLYKINIDEPLDLLVARAFYKQMKRKNKLDNIEYLIK